MSGHTPGPWTCSKSWKAPNSGHSISGPNGEYIADVYAGHHPGDAIQFDVGSANARLIAKAPELLSAARLGRNVVIYDNPQFEGEWIAVPKEDFVALRTVVDEIEVSS